MEICQSSKQHRCCVLQLVKLIAVVVVHVESSTYYISPSPNWCSTLNSCISLSQAATLLRVPTALPDLNISLILLPGRHTLHSNFTVANLTHFSLKSYPNHLPAVINCGPSSRLQIYSIPQVDFHRIIFNGCLENEIRINGAIVIDNSTFSPGNRIGRALIVEDSNVLIRDSHFLSFKLSRHGEADGGAIYCSQSYIKISSSKFIGNSANQGGALFCTGCIILAINSSFTHNRANNGGVLYAAHSLALTVNVVQAYATLWKHKPVTINDMQYPSSKRNILFCIGTTFSSNIATSRGGVVHFQGLLHLNKCFAFNNTASSSGGVIHVIASVVQIYNSSFQQNKAGLGGVGFCSKSAVVIIKGLYYNNIATDAGALHFRQFTNARISFAYNNSAQSIGSCLYLLESKVFLTGPILFEQNSANYGAVMSVYMSEINCNGSLNITNNDGLGTVTIVHSRGHLGGIITFMGNNGSLYISNSDITISGSLNCTQQIHVKESNSDILTQGGCLTFRISSLTIKGNISLANSTSTIGGGMVSITSKITLTSKGCMNILNNTAKDSGGGAYLYQTQFYVYGSMLLQGNKAKTFGGGMHCISTTIILSILSKGSYIKYKNNVARYGGGVCLEANSKFYMQLTTSNVVFEYKYTIQYIENTAKYGGAIYVADNTTSVLCATSEIESVTAASQSECFIQILRPIFNIADEYPGIGTYTSFERNIAHSSGAKVYGGLLDRCTVKYNSYSSGIMHYSSIPNFATAILNETSSEPVRVCLCESNNALKCNDPPKLMEVVKGSNFMLKLAALDQVNHTVSATIIGTLKGRRGHIGDGHRAQHIHAQCTHLNFSIFSFQDTEELRVYAKGPCNGLGISSLRIKIRFASCPCPTGFEPIPHVKNKCICGCHHVLKRIFPFISDSDCNSKTLLFTRSKNFWITIVDQVNTSFLSYEQCPSDYCYPSTSPVLINFSNPNGIDVQCAFNRTGVLCGSCQPNLSLSLGSSHCIECPYFWSTISAVITIGSFMAGLGIVIVILCLNLTVATGTINAMIFYANVLAANGQLFEQPNFFSVFVSWLNLDIGFDVCFVEGLNAYFKTWLHLIFPMYMILIVVAIIIASQYSTRFAKLISCRNPIATLATLILISYAKLLYSIIEILEYAVLHYTPLDDSKPHTKVVWLRDGSVEYLKGAHIPLYIVAILILLLGLLYTFPLLTWQWFVRFSNKPIFSWVRNTRLSSFIDAYHAPYTSRYRYWTGLLLLARVILYLTAAINISGEPSVNLLAVSLVIGFIILLYARSGIGVYKNWILNSIELTTYFNISILTACKFYVQLVGGNHEALAYVSISVQMVAFFCAMLHHVVAECHATIVEKCTRYYKNRFSLGLNPKLGDQQHHTAPSQPTTFSEVAIRSQSE